MTTAVSPGPRPPRGRHRAPRRRRRSVVWGSGLLLLVVVTAPLGRGTGAAASDLPVTSPTPAVGLADCRTQTTALLADDLARVSTGMPDAGTPGASPGQSPWAAQALAAYASLVGEATSDVLNTYHRDADALLAAYSTRIVGACRAAGAR